MSPSQFGTVMPQSVGRVHVIRTVPQAILTWFVQRWQVEVTFEEVRAHLGVETPQTMLQTCG